MKGKLLFTLLAAVAFGLSAEAPYTPPFSENFNSGMGEFTAAGDNPIKVLNYYGEGYSNGLQYAGSGSETADAWLFTPALTLKADLVYKLTYSVKITGSNTTNKIEWKAGNSASPDAMTASFGNVSYTYNSGNWETTTITVKVPADGDYYLGMYVLSDAGQGNIYFDNLNIGAGENPLNPAVTTAAAPQFAVAGDKLTTSIGITVPSQNISGDALTGDVTVKVNREGFETPVTLTGQPGETVTFTDNDAPLKSTTYTIACVSNGHESKPLEVVANPSLGTPKQVETFNVVQAGNVFTFTWDAVTEPVNSSFLFIPSAVTYTVKCGTTEIAKNIAATTTTYTVPKPEFGQQAVAFSIVASFASKSSSAVTSDTFIVGDPLAGEFRESFTTSEDRMGYANEVWVVENDNKNAWKPSVGSTYPTTVNPQDGDKGCLEFNYTTASDLKIWSPQLDLSSLSNPKLKFWVYLNPTSSYETKIQAGFETTTGDILLGEQINMKSGEAAGWKEYTFNVPEEAHSGVTRLMFVGTGGTYGHLYIDNISILGYFDHNLAVEVTAPAKKLAIGEKVNFPAKVINKGGNAEEEWTMALYADNEMVGEVQTEPVPESGSVDISIPFTALPKYAGKEVVFEVRLSLTGDGDRSDNTASVTIPVVENELAVATGLQAVSGQNAVALSWVAPVVSTEPAEESVTESFEDWENGATTPQNGWVFIDADDAAQSGINNLNAGQKFAAMVMENYAGNGYSTPKVTAHDGGKCLVMTPPSSYSVTSDNWIVSPEVKPGSEISFYVQINTAYTSLSGQKITILSSTGGTATDDFTIIEDQYISAKGSWEEHTCTLPSDAKRFAIRFNSSMGSDMVILFDSFSFTASTAPAVHTGYNLYRNHELIAAALPATQTSYTDSEAEEGKNHTYHLTALYDKGESSYSESATGHIGTLTAVEEIEIGADAEAEYYSLQGIRLASPVPGQIVIVRKAGRTFKAIIR